MSSPVKLWRNQTGVQKRLGGRGKILSWTIIRVPPMGHEGQAPYPVVLVAISGKHYLGQLVDYDKKHLKIGQEVTAVLRKLHKPDSEGIIPYGIKFKPLS